MHGRCQFSRARRTNLLTGVLALCVLACIFLSPPTWAQTQDGFTQPVTFKILNATSGGAGAVERLTIDYMSARANNIVDIRPSGSAFTIPAVPLRDAGQYIVTAWWQNVPYWFSYKGREMVADTLAIHVFNATADIHDAAITGLTVVAQRQGDSLKLEYLLEIVNSTSPQQTLLGDEYTLALAIPRGLELQEATFSRGPKPTPITTVNLPSGDLGLAVPLTWGKNTIRLSAILPWHEGLDLPVGSNLPVQSWGFMVSPAWVQVNAMGLQPDPAAGFSGYSRFLGPEIEANRRFSLRLNSGEHQEGKLGQIFATDPDSTASDTVLVPTGIDKPGSGIPLKLILVLALGGLILLFVAYRKTRT